VSSCSWIIQTCRASLSGTYHYALYGIHSLSSMYSVMAICCSPLFIQIASIVYPGYGSPIYASTLGSEMEGWPWVGWRSTNQPNCTSRFYGFRTTYCTFSVLASLPSGRSPSLLVEASIFPVDFTGLVLATGAGDLRAVQDSLIKTGQFGYWPFQQPNPPLHEGPIPDPCLSTTWLCPV